MNSQTRCLKVKKVIYFGTEGVISCLIASSVVLGQSARGTIVVFPRILNRWLTKQIADVTM